MHYYGKHYDDAMASKVWTGFLYRCFVLATAAVVAGGLWWFVYANHQEYLAKPGLSLEQKQHSEKYLWGMKGTDAFRNLMPR